jgi:hypothetical protein
MVLWVHLKTCLEMDRNLITSVLGFNLKADITDKKGNVLKSGARTTYFGRIHEFSPKVRIVNEKFFTNFNEDLLAKIKEHRRIND